MPATAGCGGQAAARGMPVSGGNGGGDLVFLHPHGKFDNHARPYRHITALPLAAAMGAEIRGVDPAHITDAQFTEVEDALFRHKMIFFRGRDIGHAGHHAFSRRFGQFAEDAYTEGVPGFREVQPIIKEADDRSAHVFGSGWHTDSPFLEAPPSITILRAVETPPYGGDTLWADGALALRMLGGAMRAMLAPLRVRFSMRDVLVSAQANAEVRDSPIGRLAATRTQPALPEGLRRKVEGSAHPLLRTHPRSGEQSLYLDSSYAIGIEGMADAEARPLLAMLCAHLTQPAFTCRLRWEPGTVALWDNRLCVHQAFNDYDGFRREMYRTTVAGEQPG
ncbi:MAG TPA: TauD/TfdA family dioxygenase [Steroidobacteraceae bacterium]|nr:TauD/TfdA family dioxygenase [Steroidobacteraceae bacterium]